MGEPWFKLAPRAKEWGLVALSSNYELYGDISARVMELLGRYSAWLEVYILYLETCCCRGSVSGWQPSQRKFLGAVIRPLTGALLHS